MQMTLTQEVSNELMALVHRTGELGSPVRLAVHRSGVSLIALSRENRIPDPIRGEFREIVRRHLPNLRSW